MIDACGARMSCESSCRKSSRSRCSARMRSVWRTSCTVTTHEIRPGQTAPKIQYCRGISIPGKREAMNISTSVALIENAIEAPTRVNRDITLV